MDAQDMTIESSLWDAAIFSTYRLRLKTLKRTMMRLNHLLIRRDRRQTILIMVQLLPIAQRLRTLLSERENYL